MNLLLLLFLFSSELGEVVRACGDEPSQTVSITGTVKCRGVAIPNVVMRLQEVNKDGDITLITTKTWLSGYFVMSSRVPFDTATNGEASVYLEAVYVYHGHAGSYTIEQSPGHPRTSRSEGRKKGLFMDFSTVDFNDEYCNLYVAAWQAFNRFYSDVRLPLPFETLTIRPHSKTTNNVMVEVEPAMLKTQPGITMTRGLMNHYFALVVYLGYVGEDEFPRLNKQCQYNAHYSCRTNTNAGRAFAHGWAMWWAAECGAKDNSGSILITKPANVATSLKMLQKFCHKDPIYSDSQMWKVIRDSASRITTLTDFIYRHHLMHGCTQFASN